MEIGVAGALLGGALCQQHGGIHGTVGTALGAAGVGHAQLNEDRQQSSQYNVVVLGCQ